LRTTGSTPCAACIVGPICSCRPGRDQLGLSCRRRVGDMRVLSSADERSAGPALVAQIEPDRKINVAAAGHSGGLGVDADTSSPRQEKFDFSATVASRRDQVRQRSGTAGPEVSDDVGGNSVSAPAQLTQTFVQHKRPARGGMRFTGSPNLDAPPRGATLITALRQDGHRNARQTGPHGSQLSHRARTKETLDLCQL